MGASLRDSVVLEPGPPLGGPAVVVGGGVVGVALLVEPHEQGDRVPGVGMILAEDAAVLAFALDRDGLGFVEPTRPEQDVGEVVPTGGRLSSTSVRGARAGAAGLGFRAPGPCRR